MCTLRLRAKDACNREGRALYTPDCQTIPYRKDSAGKSVMKGLGQSSFKERKQ